MTQVVAVAAFLRVINALENIRSAILFQQSALLTSEPSVVQRLLELATEEIKDAIAVLAGGGLHPDAVALLEEAKSLTGQQLIQEAITKARSARDRLRDPS